MANVKRKPKLRKLTDQEKYTAIKYLIANDRGCSEWHECALLEVVREIVNDIVRDTSETNLNILLEQTLKA
jgi:hypothetical protein